MKRRVFYDEFDKVGLWGQELFNYLHNVYSEQSRFCLILFSHRYRTRAWTRLELRAAQTRLLEERESYILPIAIDEGAVPDEFASIGYWPFEAGDEQRIADAAEEKINDYLGMYYFPLDEIAEILKRDLVSGAILDGFRHGIKERRARGDEAGAQALAAIAVVAMADAESLNRRVRAVVDLVLFAEGAVGSCFDDNGSLVVYDEAAVKRWTGSEAPLLFSAEGWSERVDAIQARLDALEADAAQEQDD